MFQKINATIEGGLDYSFPKMAKVAQTFPSEKLSNIEDSISQSVAKYSGDLTGKRIAITAGSRGITNIVGILKSVIEALKDRGAKPFIVAAMGSHGGATAEGQSEVLTGYGITEDSMGVDIICDMDAVLLGNTAKNNLAVYCQKDAYEADGIVVINKIKPHADFKAKYESGLCKMLVVGLGKHKGATAIHDYGFEKMGELLPEGAELFLKKTNVLFGIGIIENAYDEIMALPLIPSEKILEEEPKLLDIARENIASLLLPEIDVLIIEEIGKDYSGEGMDPNVTGRPGSYLYEGFSAPPIGKIVVLGVSKASHGNGVGIGMADISTIGCLNQINLDLVYTNALTATILGPAKIPLLMNDDRDAISVAVRTVSCKTMDTAKIVRIKNTLHIHEIWVSECLEADVLKTPNLKRVSEYTPMEFSSDGILQ